MIWNIAPNWAFCLRGRAFRFEGLIRPFSSDGVGFVASALSLVIILRINMALNVLFSPHSRRSLPSGCLLDCHANPSPHRNRRR
jgi:hypothetical protein